MFPSPARKLEITMRIFASVFLAFTLVAVSAVGAQDGYPARSYKVVFVQTSIKGGMDRRVDAVKVRWVRSTGEWQELTMWASDPSSHVLARRDSGHQT